MDSILLSVKKVLGITEEYTHFDVDIIMAINTVLTILTQMGVGPDEGFMIQDEIANWTDFLGEEEPRLECVKTYTNMKVKLIFDPPLNSSVIDSMNRMLTELEWRISATVDQISKEQEEWEDE